MKCRDKIRGVVTEAEESLSWGIVDSVDWGSMDSAVSTKVVHKDSAYEEDMEQCRLSEYGQGRLREYGLCKLM